MTPEEQAIRQAAAIMGRKGGRVGGKATTPAKVAASRINGARPQHFYASSGCLSANGGVVITFHRFLIRKDRDDWVGKQGHRTSIKPTEPEIRIAVVNDGKKWTAGDVPGHEILV